MTPRPIARGVVAAAAIAAVLTLTGCAGTAEPNPASSPTAVTVPADAAYNDEDLHFAQALAPDHDQAIEMSTMLLNKSQVNPEVRAIAKRIRAQHQPQLDLINRWEWAQERAAHGADDADQDGPSHHGGADGLMTEDQMQTLDLAIGPTATTLYLDGMI